MKVCVFGAGAIGGHVAARLARGGADVAIVARGAHLTAIQRDGLQVHASDGALRARVQATADPATLPAQDMVVVTVKAPALPAVAAAIAPLLRPDTPVAFFLNGIPWFYFHAHGGPLDGHRLPLLDPDGALWRVVGPERAVAGVVYAASTVTAPGVIHVENPNSRIVLGRPDGTEPASLQELAACLRSGGMGAPVSPAIRDEIWNKLFNNLVSSSLAVLSQSTLRQIYQQPACVEAARRIMAEAMSVATALGAAPDPDHERRIAHSGRLDHKPSMLQDLELGRSMEIDSIFGAPQELARVVGVATPMIDLVVALVKLRARSAGLYA
jgi:2-dehydropantoate 2-reductase